MQDAVSYTSIERKYLVQRYAGRTLILGPASRWRRRADVR